MTMTNVPLTLLQPTATMGQLYDCKVNTTSCTQQSIQPRQDDDKCDYHGMQTQFMLTATLQKSTA